MTDERTDGRTDLSEVDPTAGSQQHLLKLTESDNSGGGSIAANLGRFSFFLTYFSCLRMCVCVFVFYYCDS